MPLLGDHAIRTLTIMGFPADTTPGILDELNTLGFEYRWMTRFLPLDKAQALKLITKKRRQWFAKRKSVLSLIKESLMGEQTLLVDSDADNKAIDADAALQDVGGDYVSYGYFTATISLTNKDAAIADARIHAIERIINGRDFAVIDETVNAMDAWLGMLAAFLASDTGFKKAKRELV